VTKDAGADIITLSKTGQQSVLAMLPIWQADGRAPRGQSRGKKQSDYTGYYLKCEGALKRKIIKQRTIEACP